MSSAQDAHVAHAHDAHDAHAFDGEPVSVLAPDEPRTPGWIPALGLALFVAAAVVALAGGTNASEGEAAKDAQSAATAAPPAPAAPPAHEPIRPVARPVRPPPAAEGTAPPAGAGNGPLKRLTPDQIAKIRGVASALPAAKAPPPRR
jgi:hypothetical protein